MKISVISLGCDKNRIDTENMLAYLSDGGYSLTLDEADADTIIVNTCAFIDAAKSEAIDAVLEAAERKKDKCRYVIVTGCLPQRYLDELKRDMPEVDAWLGTANYSKICDVIQRLERGEKTPTETNPIDKREFTSRRILSTPAHYAYLKIAEGCDNKCTYCAIPKIRGKYTSRPIDQLVEEARSLIENYGVKELILVAQDTAVYGKDLYGESRIIELIEQLEKLDVQWIRLLYAYPEAITDGLINKIAHSNKICKYVDIPLQHVSDTVLRRMNRRIDKSAIKDLLTKIRLADPSIAVRSTFIAGFPGESEEEFNELMDFIREYKLDKCGFFAYSREEGTAADKLSGHLPEDIKERRRAALYAAQEEVMRQNAERFIGTEQKVLYEGIDYDRQLFYGRTDKDAPDIDTLVYFTSDTPVEAGSFVNVKITRTDNYDLIGEITNEFTN